MRISDWSSDVCSSDLDGDHVEIEDHREVGGDGLDEFLEARRAQQRQDGLVHTALDGAVAAPGGDEVVAQIAELRVLAAQALDHELLAVDDALAVIARRKGQHVQQIGMPGEESSEEHTSEPQSLMRNSSDDF